MTALLNTISPHLRAAFRLKWRNLVAALNEWWDVESDDWDDQVTESDPQELPGGSDLWDHMPVIDSKAVARTTNIFEEHLGIPLKAKLIKPGGYESMDEMINDLVPKMMKEASKKEDSSKRKK